MYQIIIFLLIFSSIILGTTASVIFLMTRLFTPLTAHSGIFYIIGFGSSLCFIVGMLLSYSAPSNISVSLYQYGALWIGVMSTIMTACLILLFIAVFFRVSYTTPQSVILFFICIILINIYGIFNGFNSKIIEYSVSLPGEHKWHGKKIVMIADTHYGNIHSEIQAQKLVSTINRLDPEIVLIPGDFYDGPKIDFKKIADVFTQIQAPEGILFANGNHEEYRNTEDMLESLKNANIKILNNKKITINGIDFSGVTYHTTETQKGLIDSLNKLSLSPEKVNILLKHKPTGHKILSSYPIHLVVSGHSHYGQAFPFSLFAWGVYGKYVYGMVQDNTMTSITTSGVGTWGPPQRIGTNSEIVVINIR